ncbi:M48 family metalloprotease, partial [Pseudomonas viridiflava]
ILRPALMLGIYFLESFDNAVNHWSRTRGLAADVAAASLGGNAAAASALVRISAIQPLLQERLDVHMTYAMNSMSDRVMSKDLPTAVITELAGQPVTLPDNQLTFQLSHPSDTHPSNAERIVGLQAAADDAIRAGIRP